MKTNLKTWLGIATSVVIGLIVGYLIWGFKGFDSTGDGSVRRMASGYVSSKGGLNEIFVIAPKELWTGELGDTLRAVMAAPVEMINQYEPLFDLKGLTPETANKKLLEHRNIMYVKIGAEYKQPNMSAQYDVYSGPQIIVTLYGPSARVVTDYLSENREQLVQVFKIAERDRDLKVAARQNERELMKLVEEKFGMKINIPRGYRLRSESDHFVWISHERARASQGLVIYDYPFAGSPDFDSLNMAVRRDEFVKRIPGPSDGSYMITHTADPELYPSVDYLRINGQNWARMRGFWEVENDFMGGPFFNYSTVNPNTGRVVALDCYVYSPDQPKRNFLMQLDHLVYSASFPKASEAAQAQK